MDRRVSIIIASYGGEDWRKLAETRAYPSAKIQGNYEIILHHDPDAKSPAVPRNNAAEIASGEWLVFCDADDELEPNFVDEALRVPGELRYPRVRYVHEHGLPWLSASAGPEPVTLPRRPLLRGNYMVISSMMRRQKFLEVGGFDEWETWEDWGLLMKMTYVGERPFLSPGSVYRVYKRAGSRVHQTRDPIGLTRKMVEGFRKWAWQFNKGQTPIKEYQEFLARGPQPEMQFTAHASDRKAL